MTSSKKILTIASAICTIISTIFLFGNWFIEETYLGSERFGSLFDVYFSSGFEESIDKVVAILFAIVFISNIVHCVLCFQNNDNHEGSSFISMLSSIFLFSAVYYNFSSASAQLQLSELSLSPNATAFIILSIASKVCVMLEPNEKSI